MAFHKVTRNNYSPGLVAKVEYSLIPKRESIYMSFSIAECVCVCVREPSFKESNGPLQCETFRTNIIMVAIHFAF